MANVFDVTAHMLDKLGPLSHMKLQKLAYYAQAWSLVWDDEVLFPERIEAWANGPVIPKLYAQHQGNFVVQRSNAGGDPGTLSPKQLATIKIVLDFYGGKTPQWLSELTHAEAPWREARGSLPPGTRGNAEITPAAMAEYYGSL